MSARNMLWVDLNNESGEAKSLVAEHLINAAEHFPLSCPDNTRRPLMDVFDVHVSYDATSVGIHLEPKEESLRPMAILILEKEQPSADWPHMGFLRDLFARLGVKRLSPIEQDENREAILDQLWPAIGFNLSLAALRALAPMITGARLV